MRNPNCPTPNFSKREYIIKIHKKNLNAIFSEQAQDVDL